MSKEILNTPSFKACYIPLVTRNLEAANEIHETFLKDCGNLPLDSLNFSLEICEEKIRDFIKFYSNKWWEKGRKNSDVRALLVLKLLIIGRKRETLDRCFRIEGSGSYIAEFYEIERETRNPQIETDQIFNRGISESYLRISAKKHLN